MRTNLYVRQTLLTFFLKLHSTTKVDSFHKQRQNKLNNWIFREKLENKKAETGIFAYCTQNNKNTMTALLLVVKMTAPLFFI